MRTTAKKKKELCSRIKRCHVCIALIVILPLIAFALYSCCGDYGLFQASHIDDKDLQKWSYHEGFIRGAQPFEIRDGPDHCWILLHGYTSTPTEMEDVAALIRNEFNDSIYVPMFAGHGQVPSLLLGNNAETWYAELTALYERILPDCEKINVVGSSMGAMLALRLAEDKELGNIYLFSPYLKIKSGWISKELQIKLLGGAFNYLKKDKPGSINDPEGLKSHIGYMVMPFRPLQESFGFIDQVEKDLPEVTEPVLVQQSKNDDTVDPESAQEVYDDVSSKDKKILWYERSDHLILKDYDRFAVMKEMVDFEKERR